MTRPRDDREKRLAELKREVTKRGFDGHASLLQNIFELPPELQSPEVVELAARESIQTIIHFPQQIQHGWQYVPKQALLFTPVGIIHLLASIWPDEPPQITDVNGCGLLYMRVTLLLLYGHLEVVARGPQTPLRLGMEFNTVAWYYLASPLRRLLLITKTLPDVSATSTSSVAVTKRALEKLPIKFSNGVKIYGLLPGEQLEDLVFQPGLWRRWLMLLRRHLTANTLLMLTGHFVVLIQDDLRVSQGWILSYIPRGCITEIQNHACDWYNELIFKLKHEGQTADYTVLLSKEAVEDWHTRWIQHGGKWRDCSNWSEI
jgi:hypothetical protein